MTKRRRPRQVKFWATDEELQLIKKKIEISKLSQQEYLLRSALEKNILVIEGIKELIIELTKEGNELRNLSSFRSDLLKFGELLCCIILSV